MNLNVNWQCCSRHVKPHPPLIKHNRQLQGSNSPLFGTSETAFACCVCFETPHCNKDTSMLKHLEERTLDFLDIQEEMGRA